MKKDAYSEICKGLKLCPRLVPTPLWGYSLANLVRIEPRIIEAIKEGYSQVIEETKNWWFSLNRKGKCKVCGEFVEKGEIDEDWFYYIKDSSGIAYLRNLRLLCRNCHLAKHQGFAGVIGKSKEALIQFAKVNKLSIEKANYIINEAFNIRSNLNNLEKWSFKIGKFKGLKNKEIEELLEFMYNEKYTIDSWLSYFYPKYYQEVEPKIIEETLNVLKSAALSSSASIQDLMVTLLNLIKNVLTEYKIKVLEKEFKQYINLILKPEVFMHSHYYPDVLEFEDLIKNIIQHREISIRYMPAILEGKWFFFASPYDCPTLFVKIIHRLKEEKIAYSGKIPALRERYMEDKLPVMFDVPSVFALNTLVRVVEIIKEELKKKNLLRKIYFKPDIFMDKEIYPMSKDLKPYIFIY
jgi:DNA-directed RNA polymerase delta subunit